MYRNAGIAEWRKVGKQGRDNSIKAVQHTNLLQTSFSIIHEKSYVEGCIQNYHPYLCFLFHCFAIPTFQMLFLLLVCIINCKIVNSHLLCQELSSGDSPHMTWRVLKESSIAITYNTILNSLQFTELK